MSEHAHDTGDHGAHHAEAEPDNTNVALLGFFLAITTAVLVVAVWGLDIYFKRQTEEQKQEKIALVQNPDLAQLREQEQKTLSTFGVVDKDKGIYRIPIDRAMNVFLEQAQGRARAHEPQRIGPPPAAPAPAAPAPAPGGGAK